MSNEKVCTVEGCNGKVRSKGFCNKHYQKFLKYGDPLFGKDVEEVRFCSVEGCGNEYFSKGYCKKHYNKWREYGDPLGGFYEQGQEKKCSIEGCNNKAKAKGLCDGHYRKLKLYNDPLGGLWVKGAEKARCSVDGCNNKVEAKGLCRKHYIAEHYKIPAVIEKARSYWRKYIKTENGKKSRGVINQTRRARKLGVKTENFSREEVYEQNSWICGICGEKVDKHLKYPDPLSQSLDHIIPLSKGGTHTRNNVQLAHLRCNLRKSDKLPSEMSAF